MSLQVWLPLNGNLNNQGLSGTVTGSSVVYVSGKVTEKAKSTGNVTIPSSVITEITKNYTVTMCYWFRTTGTTGSVEYLGGVSDRDFMNSFQYSTYKDFHLSMKLHNSSTTYDCAFIESNFFSDTNWHHVLITNNKGTINLYKDGNLIRTYSNGTWDRTTFGDFALKNSSLCNINDFRIYDHCLSDKEIHELSKGLCLHYKLSRSCTNLVRYDSSVTIADGGTVSLVSGEYPYGYSFKATGGSKRFYIQTTNVWKAGVTYTYSFFAKADSSVNVQLSRSLVDFGGLHSLSTNWVRYSGVIKSTATVDGGTLSITTDNTSSTVTIALVKLEEGPIATSWGPNIGDDLYSQLGYNEIDKTLLAKSLYQGATFNGSDTSRYGPTKTLNPDGSYKYKFSYTGTGSNNWYYIDFSPFTFTAGQTYHYVCKVRCNSGNIGWYMRAARCQNDYTTSSVNTTAVGKGWVEYHLSIVVPSTLSGTASTTPSPRLEFYTGSMSTSGTVYTLDVDIKDCRIYTNADYINQKGIEYDCSGFGNHGLVAGDIKGNGDTPRFTGSSVFNGTDTFILAPLGAAHPTDAITVSAWIYHNSDTDKRVVTCTEGGGWNFEGNPIKVSMYINGGYRTCVGTKKWSDIGLNSWHHIAFTYDGNTIRFYIDGVENAYYTYSSTKYPITYANNRTVIGAEASGTGSSSTASGYYWDGKLSDIRIYATALSPEDILALYNTSTSIDSNGNMYCSEFVEV